MSSSSSVSFEDGLRRCLGRTDLYDRIARRFLDTRLGDAQRARAALASGERALLRKLTHDLTSTAGTLGALRLSEAAHAVQSGVDDGLDTIDLAALLDVLSIEHESVVAALQAYTRTNAAPGRRAGDR